MSYAQQNARIIFIPDILALKDLGISPLARRVFGAVSNFAKQTGRAYICRSTIAGLLRCAIASVSNALKELTDHGLLRRTGEFHGYLFPIIEITEAGKNFVNRTINNEPKTAPLGPRHETMRGPSSGDDTNNKIEKIIKKQTVCPEFKSEDLTLRQKLVAQGMHKNQAKRLMGSFEASVIEAKLEQLSFLLNRGDNIQNPAGWLVAALKKDFKPVKAQAEQQQIKDDNIARDAARKAEMLLREAKHHESRNVELALSLAKDSLAIKAQKETSEYVAELEAKIARKQRLAKIKTLLPAEKLKQMFEEALAAVRAIKRPFELSEDWMSKIALADVDKALLETKDAQV